MTKTLLALAAMLLALPPSAARASASRIELARNEAKSSRAADVGQPVQLTGRVIDADTREPLDEAWVLASYHELRSDGGLFAGDCTHTLGMSTGPDGKFSFPVEARDGLSPANVVAIKPHYYLYKISPPSDDDWRKQTSKSLSNFIVYLKRQDPVHPKWVVSGEAFCNWARTSRDASAADRYLEIQIQQFRKYGGARSQIEAAQRIIESHKALDGHRK